MFNTIEQLLVSLRDAALRRELDEIVREREQLLIQLGQVDTEHEILRSENRGGRAGEFSQRSVHLRQRLGAL